MNQKQGLYPMYEGIPLALSLSIDRLYSIHYFEYMNDFSFPGESHDFWEFCCVDKGEVYIVTGSKRHLLKAGDIIFHEPNEFHSVEANGKIAPNLVVASFSCPSPFMNFFKNKILQIDEMERNILADIIIEARQAFSCRLDDPYLTQITKNTTCPFACEQLIKLSLEHLLIHIIRRNSKSIIVQKKTLTAMPKTTKSKSDDEIFNRVLDYLEEHVSSHVTIEQVCKENLIGRSQLQKIFQEKCNLGIIEYFSKMKINVAKQMIRTKQMNFTQISEQLGYSSIHYFSRQFKKISGMTPSEYSISIKALSEGSI
ncbi:MAG: AraC family transcriptional regulator [Lachnospiraceae bacterium]